MLSLASKLFSQPSPPKLHRNVSSSSQSFSVPTPAPPVLSEATHAPQPEAPIPQKPTNLSRYLFILCHYCVKFKTL